MRAALSKSDLIDQAEALESEDHLAMPVVDVDASFCKRGLPVIDVRSPGEFRRGHIPGAFNVPLFDDAERAEVGLLYKRSGREQAMERGVELASSKFEWLYEEIKKVVSTSRFVVHCWRGGMRSRGVAWVCADRGLDPVLLRGGYQAFRRYVHTEFEQRREIIILSGPTGTGKTLLLQALRGIGEQVIDLEALACHRGSVFGAMPGQRQPTVEQFENDLFEHWCGLDPRRPVWIEGESQAIGDVSIPQAVWRQMSQAPMIHVDAERDARISFLIDQYGDFSHGELLAATQRLKKRLGGVRLKSALAAIEQSDWRAFGSTLLEYYDKYYAKAIERQPSNRVRRLHLSSPGEAAAVEKLVALQSDLVAKAESPT